MNVADFPGLTVSCERLTYVDETADDRDGYGVLWMRRRERDAVRYLRCQMCGGDPDENDEGLLWLTARSPITNHDGSTFTHYPPICATCLDLARTTCPALQESHTVMRVAGVEVYGVQGLTFRLDDEQVVLDRSAPAIVVYGDRGQEMLLAMRQVLRLTNFRLLEGADQLRAMAATSS
ncbi:MAG TPA: hypothetical protein DGG94_14550 [Micromonosporaceae bacterium]|nr:hypothetical protein [Micromonosporaceae bacterium]HCU50993.1 hypothetical protein [Micromonosporaceae bacterium]